MRALTLVVALAPLLVGTVRGQAHSSPAELRQEMERLMQLGDLAGAVAVAEERAELLRSTRGSDAAELPLALTDLGWLRLSAGDANAAAVSFEEAVEFLEGREADLVMASALAGAGMSRHRSGAAAEAERLYRESVEAFVAAGLGDHPDRAAVEKNLGDLLRGMGRLAEAEPLYRRAVAEWTKTWGPETDLVQGARIEMAGLLSALGREEEALETYRDLLESRRESLGASHPSTLEMIAAVASVEAALGRYEEAERLYRSALDQLTEGVFTDARQRAAMLDGLAGVHAAAGRYAQAIEIGEEALGLLAGLGNAEPFRVEAVRSNLATAYRNAGEYDRSLPLYRESLSRLEAAGLEGTDFQATVLHELGRLYAEIGDLQRAREHLILAGELYENTLAPGHYFMAAVESGLGALALDEEQLEEAERRFGRALEIYEKSLGPKSLYTARALGNLAAAHQARDDLEAARPPLERAIDLLTELLGSEHPDTAYYVNNLGVLHLAGKDLEAAEELFVESLTTLSERLGVSHPATNSIRQNLAYLRGIQGFTAEAAELFRETLAAEDGILENVFAIASERQKLDFVEKSSWAYERFLSLVHRRLSENPEMVRAALDQVLARKAIVLDVQSRQQESLANAIAPEERKLWTSLTEHRSMLARLLLSPPAAFSVEELVARTRALDDEIQELETLLAETSSLVAMELSKRRATSRAVVARLPADSALIEIVRFRDVDWKAGRWAKTRRYVAFVLGGDGKLDLLDLGDADELDAKIAGLLRGLRLDPYSARGQRQQEAALDRLHSLLWEGMEGSVGSAERLWIAPDGALSLVPYAALRSRDGTYLVENHVIAYVTSGRDLLGGPGEREESDLLLIANPEFGAAGPPATGEVPTRRSPLAGALAALTFDPLPGTRSEAAGVAELFPAAGSVVLEGENATEAAFRGADARDVVHLATHGFFLPGGEDGATDGSSTSERRPGDVPRNPLARSGLALAGANEAERSSPAMDGLLTSLEVSGLDLRGTHLVTLSACDTGRGEIRNGEGVFGLRRAFSLAGARNLLVSLWPVADEPTAHQMLAFYRHYRAGIDPAGALRRAQLESIAELREQLGTAPPSLWAAFVLQGGGAPKAGRLTDAADRSRSDDR